MRYQTMQVAVTMPVVNSTAKQTVVIAPVKDSRWLTLEVCREFARNKCARLDDECRFAHPPSNIEIQNGRVMCCFDSIKGRCQRSDPPCKYLHPPQHLKEQLLQNGRNNLLMRNFQIQNNAGLQQQQQQQQQQHFVPAIYPLPPPFLIQTNGVSATNYYNTTSASTAAESPPAVGDSLSVTASSVAVLGSILPQHHQQPTSQATSDQAEPEVTTNGSSSCCLPNGGNPNAYWLNPSMSSATYYSPVFYRGVNPMTGGVVPIVKPQLIPDMRSGSVAVYPCGAPSYQQVMLPFAGHQHQQHPGYQLAVPGATSAAAVHRY